ncbi:unnamed protein product, partial [marine sediment metagenome]
MYWSGGTIEYDSSGGIGRWSANGDLIPCTNQLFTYAGSLIYSFCGTGTAIPATASIYCGGATAWKVCKIQKSDMVRFGESIIYGGTIYALTEDTDYVYCGGYTTRT